MADVRSLAEEWTQGVPHGYRQIEAICQQLRTNYTLDRSARVPEDSAFPVGQFLFKSKRGADYQFATAATLMLRSLGFSTRLVSGFYANPVRYDVRKRHTAVHSSDVHFWCEVFVGAGTWVTLEPTPGYEVLSPPPGRVETSNDVGCRLCLTGCFDIGFLCLITYGRASSCFGETSLACGSGTYADVAFLSGTK